MPWQAKGRLVGALHANGGGLICVLTIASRRSIFTAPWSDARRLHSRCVDLYQNEAEPHSSTRAQLPLGCPRPRRNKKSASQVWPSLAERERFMVCSWPFLMATILTLSTSFTTVRAIRSLELKVAARRIPMWGGRAFPISGVDTAEYDRQSGRRVFVPFDWVKIYTS